MNPPPPPGLTERLGRRAAVGAGLAATLATGLSPGHDMTPGQIAQDKRNRQHWAAFHKERPLPHAIDLEVDTRRINPFNGRGKIHEPYTVKDAPDGATAAQAANTIGLLIQPQEGQASPIGRLILDQLKDRKNLVRHFDGRKDKQLQTPMAVTVIAHAGISYDSKQNLVSARRGDGNLVLVEGHADATIILKDGKVLTDTHELHDVVKLSGFDPKKDTLLVMGARHLEIRDNSFPNVFVGTDGKGQMPWTSTFEYNDKQRDIPLGTMPSVIAVPVGSVKEAALDLTVSHSVMIDPAKGNNVGNWANKSAMVFRENVPEGTSFISWAHNPVRIAVPSVVEWGKKIPSNILPRQRHPDHMLQKIAGPVERLRHSEKSFSPYVDLRTLKPVDDVMEALHTQQLLDLERDPRVMVADEYVQKATRLGLTRFNAEDPFYSAEVQQSLDKATQALRAFAGKPDSLGPTAVYAGSNRTDAVAFFERFDAPPLPQRVGLHKGAKPINLTSKEEHRTAVLVPNPNSKQVVKQVQIGKESAYLFDDKHELLAEVKLDRTQVLVIDDRKTIKGTTLPEVEAQRTLFTIGADAKISFLNVRGQMPQVELRSEPKHNLAVRVETPSGIGSNAAVTLPYDLIAHSASAGGAVVTAKGDGGSFTVVTTTPTTAMDIYTRRFGGDLNFLGISDTRDSAEDMKRDLQRRGREEGDSELFGAKDRVARLKLDELQREAKPDLPGKGGRQ